MLTDRRDREEAKQVPVGALLASVLVHVAFGLFVVQTGTGFASTPRELRTYRVKLVAAAEQSAPRRERPRPAEAAEEEHRPPPPEPSERPNPETERPTVVEEEPTPNPSTEPARAPEEGEEAVNVQIDGVAFPYPRYLENIIRQINRYWRRPSGGRGLRAEIAFTITEDGSVEGIRWVRRSGDLEFDLEARGAVEAAGRAAAFGPLPEGFPRDHLPVSFFFDPSGR